MKISCQISMSQCFLRLILMIKKIKLKFNWQMRTFGAIQPQKTKNKPNANKKIKRNKNCNSIQLNLRRQFVITHCYCITFLVSIHVWFLWAVFVSFKWVNCQIRRRFLHFIDTELWFTSIPNRMNSMFLIRFTCFSYPNTRTHTLNWMVSLVLFRVSYW